MLLRTVSFAALVFFAASAQAQYGKKAAPQGPAKSRDVVTCPWFTQGSAARALEGDVSVTVTATNKDEGSCRFTKQAESRDTLEIAVSRTPAHPCPPESLQLKGIGNEAARCRLAGSRDAEMVAGRVRDVSFNIVLHLRTPKGSAKSAGPLDDALEQVAEQVAGNLY